MCVLLIYIYMYVCMYVYVIDRYMIYIYMHTYYYNGGMSYSCHKWETIYFFRPQDALAEAQARRVSW